MKTFTLSSFSITILHSADPNAPFISPPIFFCGPHKDPWVVLENRPLEDSLIHAVAALVLQTGKRIKDKVPPSISLFFDCSRCNINKDCFGEDFPKTIDRTFKQWSRELNMHHNTWNYEKHEKWGSLINKTQFTYKADKRRLGVKLSQCLIIHFLFLLSSLAQM